MLRELDKKNKEIDSLRNQINTTNIPQTVIVKSFICLVKECEFVGKNGNGLRLHSKKHIIK